jgi:hypothetical protein
MDLIISCTVLGLQCGIWLLLACFGVWLYHRIDSRCLPYVGLYWLVHLPLVQVANTWVIEHFVKNSPLLNSMGKLSQVNAIAHWVAWSSLFASLSTLLIVLLLLSDFVLLLTKAGVKLDNTGVRYLLPLRNFSFTLGLAAVALTLVSHLMWLRIVAN